MTRFPQILDLISEITIKYMQEHREKTRKIVEQLIEGEINYLYTTDKNYLSNNSSIFPVYLSPILQG